MSNSNNSPSACYEDDSIDISKILGYKCEIKCQSWVRTGEESVRYRRKHGGTLVCISGVGIPGFGSPDINKLLVPSDDLFLAANEEPSLEVLQQITFEGLAAEILENVKGIREVLLYNRPGSGEEKAHSPEVTKERTVKHMVTELRALLSELDIDNHMMLGHSWGGAITHGYAFDQHDHKYCSANMVGATILDGTPICGREMLGLQMYRNFIMYLLEQVPLKNATTFDMYHSETRLAFMKHLVRERESMNTSFAWLESMEQQHGDTYTSGMAIAGVLPNYNIIPPNLKAALSDLGLPAIDQDEFDTALELKKSQYRNMHPEHHKLFPTSQHCNHWIQQEPKTVIQAVHWMEQKVQELRGEGMGIGM